MLNMFETYEWAERLGLNKKILLNSMEILIDSMGTDKTTKQNSIEREKRTQDRVLWDIYSQEDMTWIQHSLRRTGSDRLEKLSRSKIPCQSILWSGLSGASALAARARLGDPVSKKIKHPFRVLKSYKRGNLLINTLFFRSKNSLFSEHLSFTLELAISYINPSIPPKYKTTFHNRFGNTKDVEKNALQIGKAISKVLSNGSITREK